MPSERVRVAVRVRPLLEEEKTSATNCVRVAENQVLMGSERTFAFDQVFDQHCTSQRVYESIGLPKVTSFCNGYNATIFAYGQTGAGKTHTMGHITECAMTDVFSKIDALSSEGSSRMLSIGIVELYNDLVFDLLDQSSQKSGLQIRETPEGTVTIAGQKFEAVSSIQQAQRVIKIGLDSRRTASTNMNETSSRSHCIISVVMKGDGLMSLMNLVDLAGSERIKRAGESRIKETIAINGGLLALGNVIEALCEKKSHIPFRASKLTRLLQDSLQGNASTALIACVSSCSTSFEESLNTLKYAYRAKSIATKPVLNIDAENQGSSAALIAELQRQLAEAKAQLEARGLISHRSVIDGATTSSRDYQKTIITLEEDLLKERRMCGVLEADLFRAEYATMQEREKRVAAEQELAMIRGGGLGTSTTAASDDGESGELKQLETERDALLAEKVDADDKLKSLTTRGVPTERNVPDELATNVAEKEATIATLEKKFKASRDALDEYNRKLHVVLSDQKRMQEELLRAESRLEHSNVEREKKERQRLELKQSFESRLRAAELTIGEYKKKIREAEQTLRAEHANQQRLKKLQNELRSLKDQHLKATEQARVDAIKKERLVKEKTVQVNSLQKQLKQYEERSAKLGAALRKKDEQIAKARLQANAPPKPADSRVKKELNTLESIEIDILETTAERDRISAVVEEAEHPMMANRIRRSISGWQMYLEQLKDGIDNACINGDSAKQQQLEDEYNSTAARIEELKGQIPGAKDELKLQLRELDDRVDSLLASKEFTLKSIRSLQRPVNPEDIVFPGDQPTHEDVARLRDEITAKDDMIAMLNAKLEEQGKLVEALVTPRARPRSH